LFWEPRWKMADPEVFRARVASAIAQDAWVVDGNYTGVGARDLVWARADTIIWLDYSLWRCLRRLVPRIVERIRDQEELWPGTGDRESIGNAVFAKDPLVWFAIRTHRGRRRRTVDALARPEFAHLEVHRFRRPVETERWLSRI
jgi:hypothetical protein